MFGIVRRLKAATSNFIYYMGYQIEQYDEEHNADLRRARLLRQNNVSLVFDVGADTGTYSQKLRRYGYQGKIISFEPVSSANQQLQQRAAGDPLWTHQPIALGSENRSLDINISKKTRCSSFMELSERFVGNALRADVVSTERVRVATLDSLRGNLFSTSERIHLKMDVQGYELEVLKGAAKTLTQVAVVEVEMSYVRIYDDQPLICDVICFLNDCGFELVSLENIFLDRATAHYNQADGLFVRAASSAVERTTLTATESVQS